MKRMKPTPPSGKTEAISPFADVARLIVPIDTPPWLARCFKSWEAILMLDRAVQAVQPTRKVMKRRLVEIMDAATFLVTALSDDATREFLESAGKIQIENYGGLDRALVMKTDWRDTEKFIYKRSRRVS